MSIKISRRTVLRGIGTAMALPLLEAMMPLTALAQSAPKSRAVRLAYFMVPNGIDMPMWTPTKIGTGYELTPTLQPLANVRDYVSVLTGLTQHNAEALGDGPGDHARSASVWLTGVHPKKTFGDDIHVGMSVDQVAASHIGALTQFPSLELGCERGGVNGDCDSGYSCAYSSNISWSSANTPMAKEIDPKLVFDRLFGGDDHESPQARAVRNNDRLSILDFVSDDVRSLNASLGSRDRNKLDEYLTGVREIETRLKRSKSVDQNVNMTNVTVPSGIPDTYGEHLRLMADMLALAFQADLTRVATFQWANEASNRSFTEIGIPEGHHELSHHDNQPEKLAKLQRINQFQVTQLAYFLEKLRSIKEGDGNLLDNSLIVFGGGISDGNRHNHDDLPILLCGKGGGAIPAGRHTVYKDGTPMANLHLSMLDRVGVPTSALGDSTGRLQQLF